MLFLAIAWVLLNQSIAYARATHKVDSIPPAGGQNQRMAASVLVNAPVELVWETIHKERMNDSDLAAIKVLAEQGDHQIIEETFAALPMLKTSTCVLSFKETKGTSMCRIDYTLLKSDRFKAMEGSWKLTTSDGVSTVVELSSYIDTGLPLPRKLVDTITQHKINKRLTRIKKMAEEQMKG